MPNQLEKGTYKTPKARPFSLKKTIFFVQWLNLLRNSPFQQCRWVYFRGDRDKPKRVCALGMGMLIAKAGDEYAERIAVSLGVDVPELNDKHRLSFSQIADVLDRAYSRMFPQESQRQPRKQHASSEAGNL